MKPLEPLLPGETRSEYLDRLAMEEQMAADFASIPEPVDGPMCRARELVEMHIANYGNVSRSDMLKEVVGVELGLAEIRGADRIRGERDSLKEQSAARLKIINDKLRIIDMLRDELGKVKDLVAGDKVPNWVGDRATFETRFKIADICDLAVLGLRKDSPG